VAGASRARSGGRHSSPDLDDALAFRIHRTNRLLRTHLSRFLDQHEPGLTPEQWFVLARVAQRAPVRQVDLAEPVLGDPPNVSRLVDVLVARGYVERSPDLADRRSSLLTLTEYGVSRTSVLLDQAVGERRAVFAGFNDAELDHLAALLDRVDANLRRLLAACPPSR
jgi:MarR family transcriptional regulator, transcriptional regulator for hemolysin